MSELLAGFHVVHYIIRITDPGKVRANTNSDLKFVTDLNRVCNHLVRGMRVGGRSCGVAAYAVPA